MISFLLDFAQLRPDSLLDGVMPNKRQVAVTGQNTPTSASTATPVTSSAVTSSISSNANTSTATDSLTSSSESSGSSTPPSQGTSTSSSESQFPSSSSISSSSEFLSSSSDDSTSSRTQSTSSSSVTGSSTSDFVDLGSSTIDRSTLTSPIVVSTPLIALTTRASTYTSTYTINGAVFSSIGTTGLVSSSTTGYASTTISPSLQNSSNTGSGLSGSSKAIIGGVVGGVGGAIFLGGLAFVAWRLWGKKKRHQANFDDVYGYGESEDKRLSTAPLTTYPNQQGPVNTAANF